ncbi:hypothetical protein OG225_41415 (plasmid) [Nocardia sp. NBC_01377]|uniref:hypothetical protein n=1 Tax=Nocardia sp. NBC_01377 TaxID=2903595 RepID=UPI002F90723D
MDDNSTLTTQPTATVAGMVEDLRRLLDHDAPHRFVPLVLLPPITDICRRLELPAPHVIGGNLVVGDLTEAQFVLSAHLDESSFTVVDVGPQHLHVAACHRLSPNFTHAAVSFLGIRDGAVTDLGNAEVKLRQARLVARTAADIRTGDRAVYHQPISVDGNQLSGTGIEDRTGAVIALHVARVLTAHGVPCAVVLSDGEQHLPEGYFSRTFPHILPRLSPQARIIFLDGIFDPAARDGLPRIHPGALVVAHTGDGAGYTVAPQTFAALRDELIPAATRAGIDVRVSSAYHSRGDDWGLVTNPTSGTDHDAMFVSFSGDGDTPTRRSIDLRALTACRDFAVYVALNLAPV